MRYVDPTGHDAIVLTNPDLAGGLGHTSLLIQDNDNNWYYFYWGDKNVQYINIDDPEALNSLGNLNEWGKKNNKIAGFGGDGYTGSTYVQGDFTNSHEEAIKLRDIHQPEYTGDDKNPDYFFAGNSCLLKSMELLSLGVLYNGVSASKYVDSAYQEAPNRGTSTSFIPNAMRLYISNSFYNNAFVKSDYLNQLSNQKQKYENMSWANKVIYKAGFHMFRINILLGIDGEG